MSKQSGPSSPPPASGENGQVLPPESTGEAKRILMVTGDAAIGPVLERPIIDAGYRLTFVREGARAVEHWAREPADAAIVDLTLPDVTPGQVFQAIRGEKGNPGVPILVVSSRSTEADRIAAFELGADDFVAVPFSTREVLLRLRVLLRSASAAATPTSNILTVGLLRLDRAAHRATAEEQELSLSVREFGLLEALMERSERVLSRQFLLDTVWGPTTSVGVRAVDAYVTRLRRKLGPVRDYVETVSSVGYRLKRPQ
jgi:two-component system phosphate regulon response regulator PhoB